MFIVRCTPKWWWILLDTHSVLFFVILLSSAMLAICDQYRQQIASTTQSIMSNVSLPFVEYSHLWRYFNRYSTLQSFSFTTFVLFLFLFFFGLCVAVLWKKHLNESENLQNHVRKKASKQPKTTKPPRCSSNRV